VSRLYAGILGLLAFLATLIRGMLHDGSPEAILGSALGNLLIFAVVGGVIGEVARWIVEDAVYHRYATAWNGLRTVRASESGSRRNIGE
jgi:hypothetical protein